MPSVPDLAPVDVLRAVISLAFDVAAIFLWLLVLVLVVALVLGMPLLGWLAGVGMLLCGGAMLRLRLARRNLARGLV